MKIRNLNKQNTLRMERGQRAIKYLVGTLITFICIGLLFYGYQHWKNVNSIAAADGKKTTEIIMKKEQEEKEALISSLEPDSNNSQSIIDFLQYRALTQEKVVVTVFGSSATEGGSSSSRNGWSELLNRNLVYEREAFDSIQFIKHGNSGYSTTDLLEGKKVDLVINNQPDLVIFENAMLNNYLQAISIEETQGNLTEILKMMKEKLPNTKIIIMSSNPIANGENQNSIGLTYLDYIKASEELINKQKWLYFNTIERISTKLREENILLVDILAGDYIFLNDRGNQIWFESLLDYLKEDSPKDLL